MIESLTDEIEKKAMEYIERIDSMGGAPEAIEYMQKEIQQSAYRYQTDIEKNKKVIIGLNKFVMESERPKGLLRVDPAVGERQVGKLTKLKSQRDNEKVEQLLNQLGSVAAGKENLMPYFIEAVKYYATLGEICGVLRKVYGEYKQQIVF